MRMICPSLSLLYSETLTLHLKNMNTQASMRIIVEKERGERERWTEKRRERGASYEKNKKSSREEKSYPQPAYTENR